MCSVLHKPVTIASLQRSAQTAVVEVDNLRCHGITVVKATTDEGVDE